MEKKSSTSVRGKFRYLDRNFNLFSHLKFNMKHASRECELHESKFIAYCLSCKQSICEVCTSSIHFSHQIANKIDYPSNPQYFMKLMSEFEDEIKRLEDTIQPAQLVKSYKASVDKEMDTIIEKIKELKAKRLKEIDSMFFSNGFDCKKLKQFIKKTKEHISKYFLKAKGLIEEDTIDEDNFLFLQAFDLANEFGLKIQQYYNLILQIKQSYSTIQNIDDSKFSQILALLDQILVDQKKKEIRMANSKIWDTLERRASIDNSEIAQICSKQQFNTSITQKLAQHFDKANEDIFLGFRDKLDSYDMFYESFRSQVYESVRKFQSLSELEKMVKMFEEKLARKINMNSGSRKINLNKSMKSKLVLSSREHSPAGSSRSISVRSSGVDKESKEGRSKARKKSCVSAYGGSDRKKTATSKYNDLDMMKDVEERIGKEDEFKDSSDEEDKSCAEEDNINVNLKLNMAIDKRENIFKALDKVFMPKSKLKIQKIITPKNKEMKTINTGKYKVNQDLADKMEENSKILRAISSKDKVNLQIPTIRKFYSFMFLDFLRATLSKNPEIKNEKSLMELFDRTMDIDHDKYKSYQIKVIEGTDEIQLYNKAKSKMEKIKVELDPRKMGTKTFYRGSRSFLLQGKIYISGGKDFNGDKQLFLVYSISDRKLIKLSDMKYPRSFHTFVFHEHLRALIALGGENNNSCEMYDFYLNMWNDLPEMNIPRANTNFVVNSSGTLAYSLFGLTGDIVNKQLTEVVEVIDMIDMNKGWYKVDYKNKTGLDLKTFEPQVTVLSNDKILIFGGKEPRNPNPQYVVFDMKSLEMSRVDLKQAEAYKKELSDSSNLETAKKTIGEKSTPSTSRKINKI